MFHDPDYKYTIVYKEYSTRGWYNVPKIVKACNQCLKKKIEAAHDWMLRDNIYFRGIQVVPWDESTPDKRKQYEDKQIGI